jgi:hypothetical protein
MGYPSARWVHLQIGNEARLALHFGTIKSQVNLTLTTKEQGNKAGRAASITQ